MKTPRQYSKINRRGAECRAILDSAPLPELYIRFHPRLSSSLFSALSITIPCPDVSGSTWLSILSGAAIMTLQFPFHSCKPYLGNPCHLACTSRVNGRHRDFPRFSDAVLSSAGSPSPLIRRALHSAPGHTALGINFVSVVSDDLGGNVHGFNLLLHKKFSALEHQDVVLHCRSPGC